MPTKVKIIGRANGKSAVAAAAYRAGEDLYDERLGRSFNYEKKSDVIETRILAPENAPDWIYDRSALWNAIEAKEDTHNRKASAQLAREDMFTIERAIPLEDATKLVYEFTQKNFVDKGMVADIAIHEPDASDGETNPHFHVMLTMRDIDVNDVHGFGKKNRSWNDKNLQSKWREEWAKTENEYLKKNNIDILVIDKSYAELGIDKKPVNLSMEAYQMEQRGVVTDEGDRAREAIEYNKFHQIAVNAANWVKEKTPQLINQIREYWGYGIQDNEPVPASAVLVNAEIGKQAGYLENILESNRERNQDNDREL